MEKTHDALCPRCKAVVLGAANCCWQCGEYVLVETQAALAENAVINGQMNGHSPDAVTHQLVQAENAEEAAHSQHAGVHFIGDSTGNSVSATVAASDSEAISAVLVDPTDQTITDPNGIMLGPTILRGQPVTEAPREVRTGSPFSGMVDLPPQKLPAVPKVVRPTQDTGWYNVLIDAAPYGCLPLVAYAVVCAWGAGWSFKAGLVAAFFALCFGLPGLLGPRWKWCLGGMIVAAPILVIASWQILLGR